VLIYDVVKKLVELKAQSKGNALKEGRKMVANENIHERTDI
jgi:hypothetical protein